MKRFWSYLFSIVLFLLIMLFLVDFFGINNYTNSDRSALISAIVAVFVFGAGLISQMVGNKIKQMQKDKQLKRVFLENLKTILEGLKLQIDNYKEIINTLKSPSPENVMLSSFAELDYFEINNIPAADLFRIFIDFQKGKEKDKIKTLENLRKQLRFIENSRNMINTGFEKLYDSVHNHSEKALDGIVELGQFFDKEATRLFHTKADIESDHWFKSFAELWGETKSLLKISDDTFTDYEKLEKETLPKYIEFARDNMEDPRTPIISTAFSKANSATYQRKDTIRNLIKFVEYHLVKYNEAKSLIEKTILVYEK